MHLLNTITCTSYRPACYTPVMTYISCITIVANWRPVFTTSHSLVTTYKAQGSYRFFLYSFEIQSYLRLFEQDIKKSRVILTGDVIVITVIILIKDMRNFSHFTLLWIITVTTFKLHRFSHFLAPLMRQHWVYNWLPIECLNMTITRCDSWPSCA